MVPSTPWSVRPHVSGDDAGNGEIAWPAGRGPNEDASGGEAGPVSPDAEALRLRRLGGRDPPLDVADLPPEPLAVRPHLREEALLSTVRGGERALACLKLVSRPRECVALGREAVAGRLDPVHQIAGLISERADGGDDRGVLGA